MCMYKQPRMIIDVDVFHSVIKCSIQQYQLRLLVIQFQFIMSHVSIGKQWMCSVITLKVS